ncbi:hypothetical protein [Streptomyces sp. NBC_00289]
MPGGLHGAVAPVDRRGSGDGHGPSGARPGGQRRRRSARQPPGG